MENLPGKKYSLLSKPDSLERRNFLSFCKSKYTVHVIKKMDPNTSLITAAEH